MPIRMSITRKSIDELKQKIPLSQVFEWIGANVVYKSGHNGQVMAYCPFCDDATSRNPACSINDEIGLFNCFRCHRSGDAITAVMNHEDCTFTEAVEALSQHFDIPIEYNEEESEQASKKARLVSVLEAAQAEFESQREDKHFAEFLEARSMDPSVALAFGLGLSLYSKADDVVRRLSNEFSEDELVQSGLCYKNEEGKIILRMKNRITFPILTETGKLVAFGGRDITGKSPAKYKNSPESSLFRKRNILYGYDKARPSIRKTKTCIICEGYMDTIALHAHGFDNAIGAMGTAITSYNFLRLSKTARVIYIALDSDDAGVKAAMRISKEIPRDFDAIVKVVSIQGAKDPDELLNQQGKPPEEFQRALDCAVDVFMFCLTRIIDPYATRIHALSDNIDANGNDNEQEKAVEDDIEISISQLKIDAKESVQNWIREIYGNLNIYQKQALASCMVRELGLLDSWNTVDHEWEKASVTFGKNTKSRSSFRSKKSQQATKRSQNAQASRFAIRADTHDEDILIMTLYSHPESRNTIKKKLSSIDELFTSPVRQSLFHKIETAYSKGQDKKELESSLTRQEVTELARIILTFESDENSASDSVLADETIEKICRNAQVHSLKAKIKQESESTNPNIENLIQMKMQLSQLV